MAGETVLIVEDDATLLRGLKDNFDSRGYRVLTAADGEAGLRTALEAQPDVVLLDIMLPRMNGFEICRQVREAELDMPIIMLTAKGQEEDIVRGLNLGADDYMTKPFGIKELLARVNAFLRRRQAPPTELYRFGRLELDLASHKLFRQGAEVQLTPKEFRLLELFVRRAGRALTRDEIMDNVWGTGVLVTSRSVDRCVTTLRAKIEPDTRRPTYIRTIRDVGYRFEADDLTEGPLEEPVTHRRTETEPPEILREGTRLGRYSIRSFLDHGGMGQVYRARDTRLERDVAIKVLPSHLSTSSDALARFEREARAVASLSHPAILAIYDVGGDGSLSYAVMELLEGETLRERIGRGVVDWQTAARIGIAVADGLSAAHTQGIVHRDIKPSNIFLTDDGAVKILDFGLARVTGGLDGEPYSDAPTLPLLTVAGTLVGTAGYLSPEQLRGQVTDARSDLFSLGCVLYEMVTGHGPFTRETFADTMAAILREDPPPLGAARIDLPHDLVGLIERCLDREPQSRVQSARELARELRALDPGVYGSTPR